MVAVGFAALYFAKGDTKSQSDSVNSSITAVSESDWVIGKEDAPVTLIEYSDFQCPACAFYLPLVEDLRRQNADKLRFVYRHFPLSIHRNAEAAAIASEAAGRQGKFWAMYQTLFERQNEWEGELNPVNKFAAYAALIGADVKQFLLDYQDKALKDKVRASYRDGFAAGVSATPTFFLNGQKITNPQSPDVFQRLIDEAAAAAARSVDSRPAVSD